MIKKLLFIVQSLALFLPVTVKAEQDSAEKWLNENRSQVINEDVLTFVICEAGSK